MRPIRGIVLAVVLSLLMGVLAACSGADNNNAQKDTSTSDGTNATELKGEIVMWHSFTQGGRNEVIKKAAADFMVKHPGVKITLEVFPWGDFYTKWTTGLASGQVPDVSTALPNHVVEMIDADAIIPLNDLIDKMGRDRFYEAPLSEVTKDGQNYAIPLYSHAQVMWIRKDLLEKANLPVPQTWDELFETAKALHNPPEVFGLPVPMGTGDMMATRFLNYYVRTAGDTLLTKDGKANLTSKAAIDGINYWVKMYKAVSPESSINFKVLDQATLFYQGKSAFDFNSGFHIGGVAANSPELLDVIDAAPIPRMNANDPLPAVETSNTPLVVWKESKHPEVAKAFIEFLYEKDRYIEFLHSVPAGMLPAVKEISTDTAFLSEPTIKKFSHAVEVISEAVGVGTAVGMEYGPAPQSGLLTTQNVIEEMFQEIVLKNTPVEAAAGAAEKKLNDLFEGLE
ncbi:sugar ABC transporter substrate-binding protein [Paenibacillus oenotherae]|uniref:Sugar ABC transporter substrate-binding protein n=1 Tax=Paenibacillus oenotherae TaxID=1435645 RepID=A0ABS7D733_9BACL|nr:sugar ABC transporter substrate-binding protein [Paenibacillus oenotherae]MBW7475747.1 sugar ABC transporter substrate-binding protein [Paenibacillus oenotherae]